MSCHTELQNITLTGRNVACCSRSTDSVCVVCVRLESWQKLRNAVLDHLNNYAESVCIDCGFVERDCKCVDDDRRHCATEMTYLGSALSVTDCSVQTEPMVVFGMQPKVAPFPMFVPQSFHLSPDIRMPVTYGQHPSAPNAGMSVNALTPSVISLPPALTFPSGCPPSFVNPLSLPTSSGTQSYVSVLRPPLIAGVTVPSSSGVVSQIADGSGSDALSSRKRKLDSDAAVDVAVQTTGKSYVKKMKVRLGNFSASDFKIIGIDHDSVLSKNQSSAQAHGVALDSVGRSQTMAGEGTNTMASLGNRSIDTNKDTDTPFEKRYTTVWKLLVDSSDDECTPDNLPSASQDLPASTVAVNDTNGSQSTSSDVGPCHTDPSLTVNSNEHVKEEPHEQEGTASVPDDSEVRVNDHSMEDADDGRLVIDTNLDGDSQQSEPGNKSTVSGQSNDWECRNGMKDELTDDEIKISTSDSNGKQLDTMSDGVGKPIATAVNTVKAEPVTDASDVSQLTDSSPAKSAVTEADAAQVAGHDAVQDEAGTTKQELMPKPQRVYGKFEYTPTGEHILRCLVPKCSQTFDRKLAADVHNHVHPGFVSGVESSVPMHLQCHRCEFQAPFYHWYDLLRHMNQKHAIGLVDSSAEHTCEYCGLGFDTKDLLVSHIDFHYSNRYKCIYCGLLLLTWGQVRYTCDCFHQ